MSETTDWNTHVITEFRANGGRVGGMLEGWEMILVHHVGAKSGVERVTPLVYLDEGGRMFIFASKGGADEHPAWFHNVVANPRITVEVGAETFEVLASVLDGPERDAVYAKQAASRPNFAEYQDKTSRVIPVIELTRV